MIVFCSMLKSHIASVFVSTAANTSASQVLLATISFLRPVNWNREPPCLVIVLVIGFLEVDMSAVGVRIFAKFNCTVLTVAMRMMTSLVVRRY